MHTLKEKQWPLRKLRHDHEGNGMMQSSPQTSTLPRPLYYTPNTRIWVNALSKNHAASMNRSEVGLQGEVEVTCSKIFTQRLLWVKHSSLSKAATLHRIKQIFLRGRRIVLRVGWQFLKALVTSHLSQVCTHFISFLEWGRGKEGGERERERERGT